MEQKGKSKSSSTNQMFAQQSMEVIPGRSFTSVCSQLGHRCRPSYVSGLKIFSVWPFKKEPSSLEDEDRQHSFSVQRNGTGGCLLPSYRRKCFRRDQKGHPIASAGTAHSDTLESTVAGGQLGISQHFETGSTSMVTILSDQAHMGAIFWYYPYSQNSKSDHRLNKT